MENKGKRWDTKNICRHHMRTGAVVSANRAGSDILDESRNLF